MEDCDTTDEQTDRPQLIELAREHVGLVVALLLFVVTVGRVLTQSRFDATVALSILSVSSNLDVLVAGLMTMVQITGVVGVLFVTLWYIKKRPLADRATKWEAALGFVGFLMVAAIFAPAYLLAIGVPLMLFVELATRRLENRFEAPEEHLESGEVVNRALSPYLVILPLAFLVLIGGSMWRPTEVLTIKDAATGVEAQTTAYVLAWDPSWTSILTERDREVLIIDSELVQARVVCRVGKRWQQVSLIALFTDDVLPRCPEPEQPDE